MAIWYARAGSGNMSAIEWNSNPAGGGTILTWGNQTAGDLFYTNGFLDIAINLNPGPNGLVSLLTKVADGALGEGRYTYHTDLNLDPITANFLAGAVYIGLVISGSTGGGNITGTVTGGSATSVYGVNSTHTAVRVKIANAIGGTGMTAHGVVYNTATAGGIMEITGTATGVIGRGFSVASVGGVGEVNDVVGSDTGNNGTGVGSDSTAAITVKGNVKDGARASGVSGKIIYAPSDAFKYLRKNWTGGGYKFFSIPPAAADIRLGTQFVSPADGSLASGSLAISGSGGGAWAS